jgi:methionyl-tRNA formyltransferase
VLVAGESIEVSTGAGRLVIETLQLEGRKRLPAAEFTRGGGLRVGARLGGADPVR